MDLFVDIDELIALRDDARLRIVDTRSKPHGAPSLVAPSGAEQYAAAHIPGAIHLDYAHELADPATPYATRIAPPDHLAKALGDAGIGDESIVVAYDDGDVPYAARFVWMMRYLGRDDVRILAGGFKEWRAREGQCSTTPGSYPPAIFTARPRERLRASRAEVLAIASGETTQTQLLETQRDKTYAMRDRDIARTVRLSANDLLEDAHGGRVAPADVLAKLVDERKLNRAERTIVTCGSGVSASGAYIALLEAGFTDLAVYDGSWLEWQHDGLPTVPKADGAR